VVKLSREFGSEIEAHGPGVGAWAGFGAFGRVLNQIAIVFALKDDFKDGRLAWMANLKFPYLNC